MHRVVISGIGVVSPIGIGRQAFWKACLEGRSGARHLDNPWVAQTDLGTRIAATVEDYGSEQAGIERPVARNLDRTCQFAIGAARDAFLDAGFEFSVNGEKRRRERPTGLDPTRLATIVGSGIGGLSSLEHSHATWRADRSKERVKRYALPMCIPNAPAGQVAIHFGAQGECKALSTACAAGTMAIGDGLRLLERGDADVVIAGGAEGIAGDADGYALMGFERLRTLSTRNDDPTRASRPFDRERDGFVLGEGAAMLVLEREEHALARGAQPWARILGYATNCDAHSMMQLDESGRSIEQLIERALRDADCAKQAVDHVSAHATSTRANDRTEARALRKSFGARCDELPVTGLKSMTGHGIAASGPMEVAATALAIREGRLAPTINYEHPDPECDVRVVERAMDAKVGVALKLSYGFGGHNACLVLAAP